MLIRHTDTHPDDADHHHHHDIEQYIDIDIDTDTDTGIGIDIEQYIDRWSSLFKLALDIDLMPLLYWVCKDLLITSSQAKKGLKDFTKSTKRNILNVDPFLHLM